ncbi:MAG: hypothetical protein SCK29_13895, partial [Bacillota bacterium]|nr:hypothetical protein [Bacillota bacterium]
MRKSFLALLLLMFFVTGCSRTPAPDTQSRAEGGGCTDCHGDYVTAFADSTHGLADLDCADCHSGLDAHLQSRTNLPAIDVRGEACASCHAEIHSEWLASPHAQIPLDLFPNDPRILQCMKCHQGSGFAAVIE